MICPPPCAVTLHLPTPEATAALARRLAPELRAGDVILLAGPIGAGKSHFCRALISEWLAAEGRAEDIPSPSFTLVQVYDLAEVDIWHVDLYRLDSPDQVIELGLEEAFQTAICLVEWPDRLGNAYPETALSITFEPRDQDDCRAAYLAATDARWAPVLAALSGERADG